MAGINIEFHNTQIQLALVNILPRLKLGDSYGAHPGMSRFGGFLLLATCRDGWETLRTGLPGGGKYDTEVLRVMLAKG